MKLTDKKETEATNSQTIELSPVFTLNSSRKFKKNYRNVLVLPKLTFPDEKVLRLEISENQISGRVIVLTIEYEDILHADGFDSRHLEGCRLLSLLSYLLYCKAMKKFLLILLCAVVSAGAFAQDSKLTVNAGFLFPSTLNATVGYERPLSYGHAVELFGEVGNHWRKPDFWKGYYWDGGIVYKHRLARYKNGMSVSASARSSGRWKRNSSSDWKAALNTFMYSATVANLLLSRRTT